MEEIGVEREKVGLTPEEILSKKRDEIVQKALETRTLDPQRLALFAIGRFNVENMLYKGEYVKQVKFPLRDLSVEEVHFGITGTISVWFRVVDTKERLKIEVTVPAGYSMLSPEEREKFMASYNEFYRVYAQKEISELNRRLTRARIALETILEEVRRKEPEIFQEVLIERATEDKNIQELLEELGVEIEDC